MKHPLPFAILLVTAFASLAGCGPCPHNSYELPHDSYEVPTWDIQTGGELVVPVSLGYFPTTVKDKNEISSECSANGVCLTDGPNAPRCDTMCIRLEAEGQIPLPPTYANPVDLSLVVRIPGPPPKTTLTLPHPGVEAMFVLYEEARYPYSGPRFEQFEVTGGSVTPHIKKGQFVVEVEATATTPAGETISVHNGRYALVNLRYIRTGPACQQD